MIQQLSASQLDAIVADVISPKLCSMGFESFNDRKWVRSEKPEIRELIVLGTMKGLWLAPRWGFSLDFVPHISAGRVRWHRTAKTSIFDLSYDPYDYEADQHPGISRFVPEVEAKLQSEQVLACVLKSSAEFFDSVQTIADLPKAFEAKRARPFSRFGFFNYVHEPMAYGFALVRTGKLARGKRWFEFAKKSYDLDSIELKKLDFAFAEARNP